MTQDKILGQVSASETVDALWQVMSDYWARQDIDCLSYFLLKRGQPESPVAIFRSGFPDNIPDVYQRNGYAKHDPAARYALTTGKPLFVDQLHTLTDFSRSEAKVYYAMRDIGANNVLILPVFGPNTINGFICLMAPGNADRVHRLDCEGAQSIAQIMHLKMIDLLPDAPVTIPNPLSDRELEILRWVAQGKSNAVIADILSLSAGTVDTYLRRIFEKLGVADRTAAAVRGVSSGYILV
ncbi:MAG TPA: LuxR C-terminal-related transcriptional regulator [Sphingobium sp.]